MEKLSIIIPALNEAKTIAEVVARVKRVDLGPIAKFVQTNDFDFDNELICKILKRGYKTVDVPIHYYPRNYAEGKKIHWRHDFLILWTIVRCRFSN